MGILDRVGAVSCVSFHKLGSALGAGAMIRTIVCRPQAIRRDAAMMTLGVIATTAICFAGGYNLSKGMVHTGWALAWPRSGTIYAAVEKAARKAKHGLWRGKFVNPWDWRRGNRSGSQRASP